MVVATGFPLKKNPSRHASESNGIPPQKSTSLRKMVRGARKAMERRPEKAEKPTHEMRNNVHETLSLSRSSHDPHSIRRLDKESKASLSEASDHSLQLEGYSSPKKSPKRREPCEYSSPKKVPDKLPYIVHDHPQVNSPSKLGLIQKRFNSPTKYGSPQRFQSHQKRDHQSLPYSVSCSPPYSQDDDDDDDDDDELSIGSEGGFSVDTGARSDCLDSSWGTIDQPAALDSVLGARGNILTRQHSNSSLVSWGELSIGADDNDNSLRPLPSMVNM